MLKYADANSDKLPGAYCVVIQLKDAPSKAIYGARGANPVVIIPTKGGKVAPQTVAYRGLYGMRRLANKLAVMDHYEFVMYQY